MMETSVTTAPGVEDGQDRRKWLVLAALVFGLFLPMLDHLVVNVALPTIRADLGTDLAGLQWIVDAYTLAFAALLLTGGTLGDLYGRKRVYLLGVAVFTVASALSAMSSSTEQLIATRALQGVGAAMLVPMTLSILSATFDERERGAAIGIWGGVAGLAIAIGPLVGGVLVEQVSWQSTFWINVPVGLLGLLFAARVVPESRDERGTRRLDPPGLVLGTAAISLLTYGLIEGGVRGWTDGWIVAAFAGAIVSLAAFLAVEARRPSPMLPLRLFRERNFAGANAVAGLMYFAMIGSVFFLALYLQDVRGYSPAAAGIRLLPFSVTILLVAPIAGRISDRRGARGFLTAGPLVTAAGLSILLLADATSSYEAVLLPSFLVMGAGWAMTLAPMTSAVMASVEAERAGTASAVTNTSRELGGVLGVAALGALVTASFERSLGSGVAPTAAFVGAIHDAVLVGIAAMALAGIVGALTIRRRSSPAAEPEEEPELVETAA